VTPQEAKVVLQRLVGFWPTPELAPPEVLAWTDELTHPVLEVTVQEALRELTAMSRGGTPFRPRIGQLVNAVRATRRRSVPAALPPGEGESFPPAHNRAEYLASIRRTLAGAPKVHADARAKRRAQKPKNRTPNEKAPAA
jgi:hypothetical protein